MKPAAVIDMGTNSIRLGVVQPEADLSYQVLSQQKEMVRLGDGSFAANRLQPDAMDRAILVLRKFAESAAAYGADPPAIVATAALREAENQGEFLERVSTELGLEINVISGVEEARLICLGVLSGLQLDTGSVLVMDIGGGSTELAIGSARGPELLESLKLGAIRVAGIFTSGEEGPIQPQLYRRIQEYARAVAVRSVQRVREHGFDRMYGSSGTILNMVEMAARQRGEGFDPSRPATASLVELEELAARLCGLSLDQRRRVPGINPERADIIVAGAAVLTSMMGAVDAAEITTSDRALREGLVLDRLARGRGGAEAVLAESLRARSVLQLTRRCQFEEQHSRKVASLSCSLFDQWRELGLHTMGADMRELCYYSALLHDIGGFISYTNHHRHGYYLVRNSPLLGFDETEQEMMALIVLHHRKALPKRHEAGMENLGKKQRQAVALISLMVRLAEAMDRGHLGEVHEVHCSAGAEGELRLTLVSEGDCQMALWGLHNAAPAVEATLRRTLKVESSVELPSAIPA